MVKWKIMIWAGHITTMGGAEERCLQGLVGKPEGKGPLGRPKRRWEDKIKIDPQEVDWGGA